MNETLVITIPFSTNEQATIANRVLQVDSELKPEESKRTQSVKGNQLVVEFAAISQRVLRVTVKGFLDHATLVARIFEEFRE